MGKPGVKSFIEIAPRWLLVVLAGMGVFLMKQRFESFETSISRHDIELRELKTISVRLSTIIETRKEERDYHQ
jgi:hypothetical protein